MMDTVSLVYIVLGSLQSITEVLQISSSGHLALFQELTPITQFDFSLVASLHFGSLST